MHKFDIHIKQNIVKNAGTFKVDFHYMKWKLYYQNLLTGNEITKLRFHYTTT